MSLFDTYCFCDPAGPVLQIGPTGTLTIGYYKPQNNSIMKTIISSISLLTGIALITCISCSKQPEFVIPDIGDIEVIDGINVDEVETDNGSIGLSIDTRDIARKGYKPTTIDIEVNATTGNFSKTGLTLDEYTNMAKHSFDIDDLSDEQEAELREGVDIVITAKDENNNVIDTKTITKTSFKSSPQDIKLKGESLADQTPAVSIRSDVPHYIQVYERNSNEIGGGLNSEYYSYTSKGPVGLNLVEKESLDNGNSEYDQPGHTLYYFEPIDGKPGVYAIARYVGSDKHYLHLTTMYDRLVIQTRANLNRNGANTNPNNFLNYQWLIERQGVNNFTFRSLFNDKTLSAHTDIRDIFSTPDVEYSTNYELNFRILSFDIEWDIEPLDVRYDQPILPASTTDAAFNSTLKNCSSGELVQTVGQSETKESISTLTWEEAIAVSSEHSVGGSITVGLEVQASFFGSGAKVNGSITGNYQYTRNHTKTTTNGTSYTESESITVSTERTITVPPKKATQVTDLYQTYSNVRIPFVQRFRIRGNFMENGTPLTGHEIMSQFHFNGFNGVITDVQSDYIEATVKGATSIDQLIDTKTSAEDIPTNCG